MFASTNLVFELGFVLWLLMGWRFVLAETVGAFVLIAVMWLLALLTLPRGLEDEARAHEEEKEGGHDHGRHDMSGGRLRAVADASRWTGACCGKKCSSALSSPDS